MLWLTRLLSSIKKNMLAPLLLVIIEKVLVPRLTEFLQKKFDETGQLPTPEELTEELSKDATGTIERGTEFLNRAS